MATTTFDFPRLPHPLPVEIIKKYCSSADIGSLRCVSKGCRAISDKVFTFYWNLLKENAPKGLVDIEHEITSISTDNPTDPIVKSLRKLTSKFIQMGVTPTQYLPITEADFISLQKTAQQEQDNALLTIWPKITKQHLTVPQLQTADQIRTWLNDASNVPLLNRITELDLGEAKLRVLPPEIASFTELQKLLLMDNQLSSLPKEIGKLKQLVWLKLSGNQLRSLPKEIGNLRELRVLDLSNNRLSSLPAQIGALTHLKALALQDNQLSSLPMEIGNLRQLTWLFLINNKLSSLPTEIGSLTQLELLLLSHNKLRSLPIEIAGLMLLEALTLANNPLDSIPDAIRALPKLKDRDF